MCIQKHPTSAQLEAAEENDLARAMLSRKKEKKKEDLL